MSFKVNSFQIFYGVIMSISRNFVQSVRDEVAKIVVGQDVVVERTIIALLTGGHLLLEGMPGLAKTLLVNTIAHTVDLKFSRVQFTIDMLPSDILGSEILDQKSGEFRTHRGPVFTNLLLADEINRATPKVQGALLEAMQERNVTIGNVSYVLPSPFLVIATQNPVEQSGTFELPEAQLDRFMLCHRLNYPTVEEENEILKRQLSFGLKRSKDGGAVPETAFDLIEKDKPSQHMDTLIDAMEMVQKVHVSEVFRRQVVELVQRTRKHDGLDLGGSPRAGLALVQAARARAFIFERDYVVPEDMYALTEDVILHRIRATYETLAEGGSSQAILKEIINGIG
jgi:MoxR-like ATPase